MAISTSASGPEAPHGLPQDEGASVQLILSIGRAFKFVDDYVRPRGWRLLAQSTVWTIALAWWLMGMMTIITFNPVYPHGVLNLFGLLK